MASSAEAIPRRSPSETAASRYLNVRKTTLSLCETLAPEDCVVQSMPDVSPTKWHLAHVTWFFEHFLLAKYAEGYRPCDERYQYLFNSYYYTVGQMHRRPERGLLSRPTVAEIVAFREHVDTAMADLIEARGDDPELAFLVELGLHHEQQHQELLLTDIKHVLSCNPLHPAMIDRPPAQADAAAAPLEFLPGPEGVTEIGATGNAFCFDNETPRHRTLLRPHTLASRPVTNGEYRDFIRDGGYEKPDLWLSDGWATINEQGWRRPLYWSEDLTHEFTLAGDQPIDDAAPVAHVSYYEADACARWAGARLPTEAEWESAAANQPIAGNFMDSRRWHPAVAGAMAEGSDRQLYGDVWEWTASPYAPYPGFKPLAGSLGEYNGKFMCNQMVVRGGSCATPADHIRPTYRSFFYPDARWQFFGFRLARDL